MKRKVRLLLCSRCGSSAQYKLSKGLLSFSTCDKHLEEIYKLAKQKLELPFLIKSVGLRQLVPLQDETSVVVPKFDPLME